jgi:hypothetical protein
MLVIFFLLDVWQMKKGMQNAENSHFSLFAIMVKTANNLASSQKLFTLLNTK